MARYLLDTNHASRFLNPDSEWWTGKIRTRHAEFGVSIPSVGELWFMVFNSRKVADNARDLEKLLARLRVWEFDATSAIEFGRIQTELRRIGRPIPGIDVQIAAIARLHLLTVLSADRHFSYVPNLSVENWLA